MLISQFLKTIFWIRWFELEKHTTSIETISFFFGKNSKVEMCITCYVLPTSNFINHNIKTIFPLAFHLVVRLLTWFLFFYYSVAKEGRVYEYITIERILWVLIYNFNWKKALFIGFLVWPVKTYNSSNKWKGVSKNRKCCCVIYVYVQRIFGFVFIWFQYRKIKGKNFWNKKR